MKQLDEDKEFRLIKKDDCYGITNNLHGDFILEKESDYQTLVNYINQLLMNLEYLEGLKVDRNLYDLHDIGVGKVLTDYNDTIELYLEEDAPDELVDLLNMLEDKSSTYYKLITILIAKLGFNDVNEFLEAIDEGYLDDC